MEEWSKEDCQQLAELLEPSALLGRLLRMVRQDVEIVNKVTHISGATVDEVAMNTVGQKGKYLGAMLTLDLIVEYSQEKKDGD